MSGKFITQADMAWGKSPIGRDAIVSSPKETGAKNIMVIDAVFEPGKQHSFHHHPNQEEVIYVTEGVLEQWIEGEKRFLKAGDSCFIPAGMVHASFNSSDADARIIAILSPAIGEEGYEVEDVFDRPPWNTMRPE